MTQTFTKLIQQLHDDDATLRVIRNGKLTEAFEVERRVIHACLLSPMIFLIVVDSIMGLVVRTEEVVERCTDRTTLGDLYFADDLRLVCRTNSTVYKRKATNSYGSQRRRYFR